jgi:hypothetical protein
MNAAIDQKLLTEHYHRSLFIVRTAFGHSCAWLRLEWRHCCALRSFIGEQSSEQNGNLTEHSWSLNQAGKLEMFLFGINAIWSHECLWPRKTKIHHDFDCRPSIKWTLA